MPRAVKRYRSSSGGSVLEMTASSQVLSGGTDDMSAARELFRVVASLKDAKGRSFLHSIDTPDALALAQLLLQRAAWLDSQVQESNSNSVRDSLPSSDPAILEQLCLQRDLESGYTPLHAAIFHGNLAGVLLLLREAAWSASGLSGSSITTQSYASRQHRLTHRPMQILQEEKLANLTLVRKMVRAVDNEGLTPLQLLGKLQSATLEMCRTSLIQSSGTRFSSFYVSDMEGQAPDNELAVLTRGLNLLQSEGQYESSVDSSSCDALQYTYGFEVLTFGRANHCALGVPRSDAKASHPQRVTEFAISEVGVINSAIQVAAAAHHSLVVTREGHLFACGLNKGGRLGTGDEKNRVSFTRVLGSLNKRRVIHVAAAVNHSLCCTQEGNVYGFGSNRFGQLGVASSTAFISTTADAGNGRSFSPRRVEDLRQITCVKVAAGDKHSVVLGRDGEVFTFGDNSSGQLGRLGRRTGTVQRVDYLWKAQPCKVALDISASEQSTLVLVSPVGSRGLPMNSVYSWGHGNYLPIRANFSDDRDTGVAHRDSTAAHCRHVNPVAIASARYHNAVISDDGRVFTFGVSRESLGTPGSREVSQAIIGSPRIVVGMLPENGGGKAVAVSASEHHTVVVTSSGNVFSWGVSDGKDVLGHKDQRWQPIPKQIPGIHRATGIACAKEHNILLVATSFPPIPDAGESLESMSARQVAHHVDLFNVVPVLVMAHRVESSLLKQYCQEFVRMNLDAVVTLGRKSEMSTFLDEQIADGSHLSGVQARDMGHHPLVYAAATEERRGLLGKGDEKMWLSACKELLEGLPPSLQSKYRRPRGRSVRGSVGEHGRNRALSMHDDDGGHVDQVDKSSCRANNTSFTTCSERCLMLTANMALKTPNGVKTEAVTLSKEIRSVRKRLGQISRLECTRSDSLTNEQLEKVLRKPLLEADLVILESAIARVKGRMKELDLDTNTPEDDARKTPKILFGTDSKSFPSEDSAETEPGTNDVKAAKVYRCEICVITCPDANNLALHKNGRKHRNRVMQQQEVECKQTANSIIADKRRQSIKAESSARSPIPGPGDRSRHAWGTDIQPRYRLFPPPQHSHSVRQEVLTARPRNSWDAERIPSTKLAPKPDFKRIVKEEQARSSNAIPKTSPDKAFAITSPDLLPSLNSPPWASAVARAGVAAPVKISLSSSTSHDNKKSFSLGDFMVRPSPKSRKSAATPWSVPPAKQAEPVVKCPSKSLQEIQREEEAFRERQDQSYGVEGTWFIERKERAGSFSAIQEAEKKQRDMQHQIEEQRQIEKQIMRDVEARRKEEQTEAKGTKRRPASRPNRSRPRKAGSGPNLTPTKHGGSEARGTYAEDSSHW